MHSVLAGNTDRKKFKNLPAHKMKKHPFAGRFGIKVEVIRQFLYAKESLPNDPPEAVENNFIIDGYVDDLISENYEASLTGELHSRCEFLCNKDYIYLRPKLYFQNGSQFSLNISVCYLQWSLKVPHWSYHCLRLLQSVILKNLFLISIFSINSSTKVSLYNVKLLSGKP